MQNNTLKSNCLMKNHFVIKNFILSSMKMLKELFIDWSVSIYQCKTKFYKKHATTILQYGQYKTQAHNHTQTAVLSLLALNGVARGVASIYARTPVRTGSTPRSLLATCLHRFCTTFYCIFAALFIENALQKNQEMAFPRS